MNCPADTILVLDRCAACGSRDSTPCVSRFNKFVTYERVPDEASMRYDYALCHQCGVVSARRRPSGKRYDWLFDHFEETIGRTSENPVLSSAPLTEETRAQLKRLASPGVFVSDHAGVSRKEHLPALLVDRLANSAHVEIIGSLILSTEMRSSKVRGCFCWARTGAAARISRAEQKQILSRCLILTSLHVTPLLVQTAAIFCFQGCFQGHFHGRFRAR